MQLQGTISNGEIPLARKLNHVELYFLKNCQNNVQKMNPTHYFLGSLHLYSELVFLRLTYNKHFLEWLIDNIRTCIDNSLHDLELKY